MPTHSYVKLYTTYRSTVITLEKLASYTVITPSCSAVPSSPETWLSWVRVPSKQSSSELLWEARKLGASGRGREGELWCKLFSNVHRIKFKKLRDMEVINKRTETGLVR